MKNIKYYKLIKLKILFIIIFIFYHLFIFYNYFFPYYYGKLPIVLNGIHIAMSLNNNYIFPIMVSITSILLNSRKTTSLYFHILIGKDVEIKNKRRIVSLTKLKNNSYFTFYDVGKNFIGWKHGKKKLTVASFYRMIAAELIRNVSKIIYLDGDTLIYDDLNEMYNLNISNLYFKGIREIVDNNLEIGMDKNKYICAGVLLMNLELMRIENAFSKFRDYYLKFKNKGIYFGDQHIINDLFKDKIGFLPPKFGIWFIDDKDIENYQKLNPIIYSQNELIESINRPVIRHIWGSTKEGYLPDKPWLINNYYKIKEEWNYYAKKTAYYTLICKFYRKACINITNINYNTNK